MSLTVSLRLVVFLMLMLQQYLLRSVGQIHNHNRLDTFLEKHHQHYPTPVAEIPSPPSSTSSVSSFDNLLLFVAITSGAPHTALREAARDTWIADCVGSPEISSSSSTRDGSVRACDYKFFVDRLIQKRPPEEGASYKETYDLYMQQGEVLREAEMKKDIVFRNACPLMMQRHPLPSVHYGKQPPFMGIENYQLRRMYKVDWKVCFMQWASKNKQMARFFLFVEDDSFTWYTKHATSFHPFVCTSP